MRIYILVSFRNSTMWVSLFSMSLHSPAANISFFKESLNVRLNIFYLIAQLCKTEKYRNWVAQDLPTILDKVVPETKVGYVNLGATRRVLTELDFMNDEIREWLNQREIDWWVLELGYDQQSPYNTSWPLLTAFFFLVKTPKTQS